MYRLEISPKAQAEFDDFARYAAAYSDAFALDQFHRLNQILTVQLAQHPNMWGYFYVTGAPYRAYLFKVGRRTQFWIIYTVDDMAKTVSVLRFWNTSQDGRWLVI